MKKLKLIFLFSILLPVQAYLQSPSNFNYQAVLRDNAGTIISNQVVSFRISILESTPLGSAVYSETHDLSTNEHGLANLIIGSGNVLSGDIAVIEWSLNAHFIQIELDINSSGSYEHMGTSQLVAVPYAMHATTVENDMVDDADADPTNEMQDISLSGTDLTITGGNTVDLSQISHWSKSGDMLSAVNNRAEIINIPGAANTTLLVDGGSQPLLLKSNGGAGAEFSFNSHGETNWTYGSNQFAKIGINGGPSAFMELYGSGNLKVYLNTDGDSYFKGGKIGIGTDTPNSQLEVDGGDVEITNSSNGVILKSPNGTRFQIKVDNAGNLTTTAL